VAIWIGPVAFALLATTNEMASPGLRVIVCCAGAILTTAAWAQHNTSCDINGDGKVNVADVQLITNMEIGLEGFPCTANIGGVLGCTDSARQVVIKAALGRGCHFNYVTWKRSPRAQVIGYNVYRISSDGRSSVLLNTKGPITSNSYADVDAIAGTTYHYVVKSTDRAKEDSAAIDPVITPK
jgi:hypothetical protein